MGGSRHCLQMKKGICELCLVDKCEHIHHKDRNHFNNSKENLMCLCRDCHLLIHHNFMPALIREDCSIYDDDRYLCVRWRLKPKYRNMRMICWLKNHFKFNEIVSRPYIIMSRNLKKLIFAIIMEELIIQKKVENAEKINKFLDYQTYTYKDKYILKFKV